MKIILINGKARSGKDFASQILLKKLKNSKKLAFADKIKTLICDIFNITLEEFNDFKNNHYDLKYNDKSLTFRELIQNFGESSKDLFGKDFWINQIINDIESSKEDYIIISDFRFLIEYETLVKYFGKDKIVSLHIQDKNLENFENNDTHISENNLKGFEFDYVIDNSIKDPEILEDYLKSFINLKL